MLLLDAEGCKEIAALCPERNAVAEDWQNALRRLDKYENQRSSFTDCVSFTLMRREGIQQAFGFDGHFTLARFELWPSLCRQLFYPRN